MGAESQMIPSPGITETESSLIVAKNILSTEKDIIPHFRSDFIQIQNALPAFRMMLNMQLNLIVNLVNGVSHVRNVLQSVNLQRGC